ncbi:hypothetical protein JHK82_051794 [Glycine max]|nr:hypothetical protein JHK87_051521 [Glycine soja]KAG5093016.1 hypothetical protein JHK82_051794 [Glycine max]KAH1156469.1 hypothetical protein GYH30_051322 [Glycine max]KAH1200214.1 putative defensin-like protein 244 [Glycine max]
MHQCVYIYSDLDARRVQIVLEQNTIMKLRSILLIVWALFALLSHAYGEIRFCPKEMTLDGSCPLGTSGESCFLEFLNRLGASAMPMNCSCKDDPSHNKRQCTCNVVCNT